MYHGPTVSTRAYRKMKNLINNKLREAHNNYCCRLFNDSFDGSRRQFWKYTKAKRKDDIGISTIMVDRNPCTDPKAKLQPYFHQRRSIKCTHSGCR